jgi:hypothetical protein
MKPTKMMTLIRQAAAVLLLAIPLATFAAEQKTFATPEAAVDALMAALKADDDAAIIAIFGDAHKDLVVTVDKAANTATRAKIAGAMQTMRVPPGQRRRPAHRADRRSGVAAAVPARRDKGAWRFATEQGVDELINRRIGGNERNAITVLRAYVEAQRQYASRDRDATTCSSTRRSSAARPASRTVSTGPTTRRRTASEARSGRWLPRAPRISRGARKAIRTAGTISRSSRARARAHRRRVQLHHQRADDRGLRHGRLPCAIRRHRHHELHHQPERPVYEKDLGKTSVAVGNAMTSFDPVGGRSSRNSRSPAPAAPARAPDDADA